MEFRKVGVLGAGNIGTGVVTDLVLHGISAVVVDISEEILQRAGRRIEEPRVVPLFSKTLPRIAKEEAESRMILTTDLEELASCDFVIENVTEDWPIKKEIYEKLEEVMPSHVCFGANTSCISITQIASATRRPENVVGIHLMNPVHLKPTVEVIRGFHTSDQTIETLLQLFLRLGKEAIIVEDLPSSQPHFAFVHERSGLRPARPGGDGEQYRCDFQEMLRTQNGSAGDGGFDRLGYRRPFPRCSL